MNKKQLKLCLITQANITPIAHYEQLIRQAVEGGVTLIQLREKSKNLSQLREMALALKALLTPLKIPLIINDHVELVKEIDAEGVHLGQSDIAPQDAHRILGPSKIIGWSIETIEDLKIANQLTCLDYVAARAVFPSKNKPDCKTAWGLNGLRNLVNQSKHPVVAIGGINAANTKQVMKQGACGIAVISAIHEADDVKKAAMDLAAQVKAYRVK